MGEDMDIKQKALKKYDKHIEWAEFQMNEKCPYCELYFGKCEEWEDECEKCPLHTINGCCDGLWGKMNESNFWEDYIYWAKEIKKYIIKNG